MYSLAASMAPARVPVPADNRQRASLKQRAAEARAHTKATKLWDADIRGVTAGTLWRVGSVWVEQGCGTRCADLTNVSTGRTRTIRCAATESLTHCRALLLAD